jgi:hypothetical protein
MYFYAMAISCLAARWGVIGHRVGHPAAGKRQVVDDAKSKSK